MASRLKVILMTMFVVTCSALLVGAPLQAHAASSSNTTIRVFTSNQVFQPDGKAHQFRYTISCPKAEQAGHPNESCYVLITVSATIHRVNQGSGISPHDPPDQTYYETITNDYKVCEGIFGSCIGSVEAKLISYDKYNSYENWAANVWMEPSCAGSGWDCGGFSTTNRPWNGSYEQDVYEQIFTIPSPPSASLTLYARTNVYSSGGYAFHNYCTGC